MLAGQPGRDGLLRGLGHERAGVLAGHPVGGDGEDVLHVSPRVVDAFRLRQLHSCGRQAEEAARSLPDAQRTPPERRSWELGSARAKGEGAARPCSAHAPGLGVHAQVCGRAPFSTQLHLLPQQLHGARGEATPLVQE